MTMPSDSGTRHATEGGPTPIDYHKALERGAGAALDDFLSPRYRVILTWIVILGALARALAAFYLGDVNPAAAEIWETGGLAIVSLKYGILTACISDPANVANCLLGSDGREAFLFPSAYVPPIPIFIFMAVFKVLGVTKAALGLMLAINVLGGAVVVYYCGRIAMTLFNSPAVALTAAVFGAFHPVLVYSVATYHGVNIYLPLILCLFDQTSSRFTATPRRSIGIGLLLGVTALVRTEYLYLGLALLAGAWLHHRRFLLTALSVFAACCVISPWTIRNYVTFHRFMPIVSTTGFALYKGFNPLANGSGHWVDAHSVAAQLIGDKLAAVPRTSRYEVDLDDVYYAAAKQFIHDHPMKAYVLLPLQKTGLFWLFDIYDPTTHQLLYQLALWPLLLASLLGIWTAHRTGLLSRPDHKTVLLYFVAQTTVMIGYAVHARYRLNVEPFLFSYAASGIVGLVARRAS